MLSNNNNNNNDNNNNHHPEQYSHGDARSTQVNYLFF